MHGGPPGGSFGRLEGRHRRVMAGLLLAVGLALVGPTVAGAQPVPPTRPPVSPPPTAARPSTTLPPPPGPRQTLPPPTTTATTSRPPAGGTGSGEGGNSHSRVPVVFLILMAASAAGTAGFVLARHRNEDQLPPAVPPPPSPAATATGVPDALTHELLEVSRLLTAAAATGDTKRATVRGALTLVPADGAALVTVDSGQGLSVAVESTPGLLVPEAIAEGVLRRVAETGDVVDLRSASEPAIRNRPASVLALPLVSGGRVAAVLVVVRGQERPFTLAETRTLRALAPMAAAVLQTERQTQHAIEESLLDPLTGANNRRRFDRDLAAALEPARPGRTISLAIVDLDHFKRVNDSFGHPAGDALLKAIVERLTASVRPGDGVYRFGGEEFCLLLSDTPAHEASDVAERVRADIAARPFDIGAEAPHTATASIGVATSRAGDDAASIVARADAALYEAKEGGRNRVVASAD